jgi:thioredoxin-related protein
MNRQNLPVILSSLLVVLLLITYFLKDNLNDFISQKMQESAGTEIVLTGQQWVDSLFNYTQNGKDFEYTLMQFKSTGCSVCKQMEPELEQVKNDDSQKINVAVLNVMNPNSQNMMKFFGISAVPTHIILDNKGNEIFRKYGFISAEELNLHLIR